MRDNATITSPAPINPFIGMVTENLRVHLGAPARIIEIDDAWWVPGGIPVYNRDGYRVPESCLRRGPFLRDLVWSGPERIDPPDDYTTVEDAVIFHSGQAEHFGHFVTESLSRLWACHTHHELGRLRNFHAFAQDLRPPGRALANLLGVAIGDRNFTADRPVRFRKMFIPTASCADYGEVYSAHRAALQPAIAALGATASGPIDPRPVFLSRGRVGGSRVVLHEDQLEEVARREGWLIVHPHEMTLVEQIALLSRHRTFIGCWGSAFHGLLLAPEPEALQTLVLCGSVPHLTQLLLDTILGNTARYLHVFDPTPDAPTVNGHAGTRAYAARFETYIAAYPPT